MMDFNHFGTQKLCFWQAQCTIRSIAECKRYMAATYYVSFALLLALFQLALQLPLFTLLSQITLTIAYPSILVYICATGLP